MQLLCDVILPSCVLATYVSLAECVIHVDAYVGVHVSEGGVGC